MVHSAIAQQCLNKVTVQGGVQQFDCTTVTITPEGNVTYATFCNGIGPYWVGLVSESSFLFTFNPPVSGVILDFDGFDNGDNIGLGHEEAFIEVDGVPYFNPNPGIPSTCQNFPIIVAPSGNLMAPFCNTPFACHAAGEDIIITQPITTLRVGDIFVGGDALGGVTFSLHFCCDACFVDAGSLAGQPIFNCPNVPAMVSPAINPFLPSGNMLQYILFSDPSDTLGSILSISNTPSFAFNPATMQTGTTYYIAAIAGENLGGSVNLSGDCLDFSNAIEVTWRPYPTVEFTVDNPDLCPGDCVTITATFTGTPPFTLNYQSSITGPIVKVFQDYVETFEVCAPLNMPAGSFMLQATSLKDAFCTCN